MSFANCFLTSPSVCSPYNFESWKAAELFIVKSTPKSLQKWSTRSQHLVKRYDQLSSACEIGEKRIPMRCWPDPHKRYRKQKKLSLVLREQLLYLFDNRLDRNRTITPLFLRLIQCIIGQVKQFCGCCGVLRIFSNTS